MGRLRTGLMLAGAIMPLGYMMLFTLDTGEMLTWLLVLLSLEILIWCAVALLPRPDKG